MSRDFKWCWPHLDYTHPADPRPRIVLNRYPSAVIGVMVIAFGHGWGIRWKDSGTTRRFATDWRNFYAVNRGTWPTMTRRAALVDAFRCSRRIRGHYDPTGRGDTDE